MQDIYIKNSGITKTLIHSNNNNKNEINEIKWDADYDGNVANISLDFNNNGMSHYDMKFDNEDLANILNVPTINIPLEKRLKRDFITPRYTRKQPIQNRIEFLAEHILCLK